MKCQQNLAYNRGRQDALQDVVAQDNARLQVSTALLISEVANIIRGGHHECTIRAHSFQSTDGGRQLVPQAAQAKPMSTSNSRG